MTRTVFNGHSKSLRMLAACLLFSLLLGACGNEKAGKDILSYQSKDFHAVIRGELWGAAFEGELVHAAASDSPEDDIYRLTFTAPTALAGITLTVDPQGTFVSLGDISVAADTWSALTWPDVIRLFALQGSPLSITPNDEGDRMTVSYLTTDGKGVTLTLDASTEAPILIETDGIWLEILSFT